MKKALILFGNEQDRDTLIKSAIYLKDKFGYNLTGLLIRDIRTEVTTVGQGWINFDIPNSLFVGEMIKLEKIEFDELKKNIKEKKINMDMKYEVGILEETIKEYMREFDLLVIGKGVVASDAVLEILKENYKSLLIIGEKELDFSNKYIGNDDGIKVNRSCYNFLNAFPEEKEFISLEVNGKDENHLINYLESKGKIIQRDKYPNEDGIIGFVQKDEAKGILIMGNLSKSYFLEKISGKVGVKLIEKSKLPIFIG